MPAAAAPVVPYVDARLGRDGAVAGGGAARPGARRRDPQPRARSRSGPTSSAPSRPRSRRRRRRASTCSRAASASRPACPATRSRRCGRSAASPPDHPRERDHVDAVGAGAAQQPRADVGRRARGVDVVDQHDVARRRRRRRGTGRGRCAAARRGRGRAADARRRGAAAPASSSCQASASRSASDAAPSPPRHAARARSAGTGTSTRGAGGGSTTATHQRRRHVGGAAQPAVLPGPHERVGRARERHGAARRGEREAPAARTRGTSSVSRSVGRPQRPHRGPASRTSAASHARQHDAVRAPGRRGTAQGRRAL